MRVVHVVGGGTIQPVRPHLALCAPAHGTTARRIAELAEERAAPADDVRLHLTAMAGGPKSLATNADVSALVDRLVADPSTSMLFFSAALCDFEGAILGEDGQPTPSGPTEPRLRTSDGEQRLVLRPAEKVIGRIRRQRKDIFLVGFKTTAGASADEQFAAGLLLLKKTSCNLVLANDLHARRNMVIAPELARYGVTTEREHALQVLVDMAFKRRGLTFSRTRIEQGPLVEWTSAAVPQSLRRVVDHCIERGAYRPFNDVTVGHFGVRSGPGRFFSSRRKRNFNRVEDRDLVEVSFSGDGGSDVVAYGAKPSAGARSQYEVLSRFEDLDCIVHFHCPARPLSGVNVRSQLEFECGSHECGQNTADGLRREGDIAAVMLDKHGPNIVFRRDVDPEQVIAFIEKNFDLTRATADG